MPCPGPISDSRSWTGYVLDHEVTVILPDDPRLEGRVRDGRLVDDTETDGLSTGDDVPEVTDAREPSARPGGALDRHPRREEPREPRTPPHMATARDPGPEGSGEPSGRPRGALERQCGGELA